jgi:hypothetical protein
MVVPYQRHHKARQHQQRLSSDLSILLNKPFWIWDKDIHRQQVAATNGQCCFNHVVGLPQKDKREYPLFDYEKLLYDELKSEALSQSTAKCRSFKDKHLWVKKATGLGSPLMST